MSAAASKAPSRSLVFPALVAIALLGASALGVNMAIQGAGAQLRKLPIEPESRLKFHSLPESVPGWRMFRDDVMSAESVAELGTENYISRWFEQVGPDGEPTGQVLQLHCAYYTGMIDTVPHVPERCMVGGGMEYAGDSRVVKVPLNLARFTIDPDYRNDPRGVIRMARNQRVNTRVRLPFGIDTLSIMTTPFRDLAAKNTLWAGYFFIANGGVVASANDVRLLAFSLKDQYAYYAKVQFMSPTSKSAEELSALAGSLLDEILPDLAQRVPDWIMVQDGLYPPDNPRRAGVRPADAGGR